ncbi:hypothetical protein [Paracoccus luteus]|uniref:hypothetical protein n=1 Tax=Paracoccus luteus TaxID=2508543 RepID=UPI00106FBDDA|nr:hypothetical protein [Paracoccus luteus]
MTRASAPATPHDGSYVDIPAILAGTVVALGIGLIATTFGAALGLGSISAREGEAPGFGAVVLPALWIIVSMIATYMAGGYIAGRMRRRVDNATADEVTARDGIHGLAVWGLAAVLGAMVAASLIGAATNAVGSAASTAVQAAGSAVGGIAQGAGQLAGGAVSGLGQAAGGAAAAAAPAVAEALPDGFEANPLDYITDTLLRPAAAPAGAPAGTPAAATGDEALRREIAGIFGNLVRTGEISDADRQYLVSAAAARTGLSEAEIGQRVDQAVDGAQQMRASAEQALADARAEAQRLAQEAEDTARNAAEAARKAGVLSAFMLAASMLVAAFAAYKGAVYGGQHRDEGRIWGGLSYRRR